MTNAPDPHLAGLTFGWGAVVSLLNLALGGGVLATWLKNRPRMREIDRSAEEKLRDDLIARVEKLERKLDEERAQHEAVIALMRHRLNNADQCLDLLMTLLEAAEDLPEKVKRAVSLTKEMRVRQRQSEEHERSAMQAAVLAAKTTLAPKPGTASEI